jgi:predicted nuclease of predicted toxin-antitoxin system
MGYTPHVFIGNNAEGAEDPCMWENMVNAIPPIITTDSDLFAGLNSGLGSPNIVIYTSDGNVLNFDVQDYFGLESASPASISYSSAYSS